jgi:drug/metabolite transporter (DMT)-like permease
MGMTKRTAYLRYFAGLLMFGSNGVVASMIHLSSSEIVLLRSALGSAFLMILFFVLGGRPTAFQHKKSLLFLAISGSAMAANWLFLFQAYRQIGVSLGTLITYCGPVIVMALSPLLFREKVTAVKLAALLAALIGVFLISGQAAMEGANPWGILCAGLSAVSYVVLVVFSKLSGEIEGMENSTVQLFFTFLTVAVFVGLHGGFAMHISTGDWLPILWIGLLNTGIACWMYFSAVGALPVQTVAVCGYLEPLSAVVFSVLFLGERLRGVQILGAALIIGGAVAGETLDDLHKKKTHGNLSYAER